MAYVGLSDIYNIHIFEDYKAKTRSILSSCLWSAMVLKLVMIWK